MHTLLIHRTSAYYYIIIVMLLTCACEFNDTGDQVSKQTDQSLADVGTVEIDYRVAMDMALSIDGTVEEEDMQPSCSPRAELCNGVDDDCDQRVDEDFDGLGDPCIHGVGECQGVGILACGDSMANLTCQFEPILATDEICDDLDNDCDGLNDEEVERCCISGSTRVCGSNEGLCQSGTQSCVERQWGDCDDLPPAEEGCDGADNDCDGLIDEGLLNVCGDCGEVPSEVCDELDNDCDGPVDEGVLNACGQCGELPLEICDGQDNDCDRRTDENVTNACGGCGSLPIEVCDQEDNDCDGRTDEGVTNDCGQCGPVPIETCNGLDDDCDGRVDENLVNGACVEGFGECRRTGLLRCVNSSFSCSVIATSPANEVCNGLDDDCDEVIDEGNICVESCNGEDEDLDGIVDEGVLNACGQCGVVPAELCDEEDNDCDGTIDEGVSNQCGQCGAIPAEVCDGEDNDCDGTIDEGVLNECGACGNVPNESCDEQDNDCDGQIDETVLNICGECGPVPAELCDTQDNDCDGQIDEDFPLIGSNCTVGIGECARNGVFVCNGSGLICSTAPLGSPSIELCNSRDDDCDRLVDEDFNFRTDTLNCGSCGAVCSTQGDRCVDGSCFCGDNRIRCRVGERCQQGVCKSP